MRKSLIFLWDRRRLKITHVSSTAPPSYSSAAMPSPNPHRQHPSLPSLTTREVSGLATRDNVSEWKNREPISQLAKRAKRSRRSRRRREASSSPSRAILPRRSRHRSAEQWISASRRESDSFSRRVATRWLTVCFRARYRGPRRFSRFSAVSLDPRCRTFRMNKWRSIRWDENTSVIRDVISMVSKLIWLSIIKLTESRCKLYLRNAYKIEIKMTDVWRAWIKRPVSHVENIMDIFCILTFSSRQTLRSILRISGWVAGAIERNRRKKRDRDRRWPSRSPRRTPLFRKRDLTFQESRPWTTEVIGSERNSRLSAVTPRSPSPPSPRFGERRRSIRAVESRVRRLAVPRRCRCRQPNGGGRNNRFSNTDTDKRENCFYLTLSSPRFPTQFELHSPFRPNRVATVLSFRSIIVSFFFNTQDWHLIYDMHL